MRNGELLLYGLYERIDGVHAIDLRLIEANLREVHGKFLLEKHDDLDGIDGGKSSAKQQRVAIREGLFVALLEEEIFEVFSNFFPVIHVFSLDAQVKKVREKSKMLRDGIGALSVSEYVKQAVKQNHAEGGNNTSAQES